MGIVFSPSKMETKPSFLRKLVTFIKMDTKTRNNRKKRSKRTNITKSLEIKQSHGNKPASQCYLSSFVLQSFCFDSFARFSAFVLVVRGVMLLFWKLGFVSLLSVSVKIIYISIVITLKFGSSRLNSSVYYRIKFDSQKSKLLTSFLF